MKYTLHSTLLTLALTLSVPVMAEKTTKIETDVAQNKQQMVKVSINSASAETLSAALKGIGLSKAEAIVAYRNTNGPFKSIEQLSLVKGIGAETIGKNIEILSL